LTEWILGIGASHNGGAALLRDGEQAIAIQEERLTRVKRSRLRPAFDHLSIRYCLEAAGVRPRDLALVAVSRDEPIRLPESDASRNPALAGYDGPVAYVNHHRAHAAAAAFQSGFEEAAVLVVDGLGSPTEDCPPAERAIAGRDGWETLSIYHARDGALVPLRKDVARERSWLLIDDRGMPRFRGIGGMYSAASVQIFGQYLEAGKVMGLAPYGRPTWDTGDFFALRGDQIAFKDTVPDAFPGDARWPDEREAYANLAASVQAAVEEAVLWAGGVARALTGSRRLAYAGGVALNCLANERLLRETDFDDIFVMPAAEDSGTSIGAAVAGAIDHGLRLRRRRITRDSTGRAYRAAAAATAVDGSPLVVASRRASPAEVAATLAAGQPVGWYQGGSELGPRALGWRSVLADPRDPEMWQRLNRLKGREGFRPVAPVVAREHAERWFDMGPVADSPFMLRVCDVRPDQRQTVPSVVHVDGSARVQTVSAEQNPRLHELLSCFEQATGVPVLINTSFNSAGEPIVETPEDALWCAHRLGLRVLVLGDALVEIADEIPASTIAAVRDHRTRRSLDAGEAKGREVEVETPWGTAVHWVEGPELELLDAALAEGRLRVGDLGDGASAALEGLRRKRLVEVVAGSPRTALAASAEGRHER
jgi:carbamoyltransferase